MSKVFSRFSESFNEIMGCRWGNPQVPSHRLLNSILKLFVFRPTVVVFLQSSDTVLILACVALERVVEYAPVMNHLLVRKYAVSLCGRCPFSSQLKLCLRNLRTQSNYNFRFWLIITCRQVLKREWGAWLCVSFCVAK